VELIKKGYNDLNIQEHIHITLFDCIKIENKNPHYYIYIHILKPMLKKLQLECPNVKQPKYKLNSADKIRIENIKNIESTIEYVILDNYKKMEEKR